MFVGRLCWARLKLSKTLSYGARLKLSKTLSYGARLKLSKTLSYGARLKLSKTLSYGARFRSFNKLCSIEIKDNMFIMFPLYN
ncbi:hypothetical protein [Leptospira noguchii]|uniref:hypothetical protein n=1 Tax=Leptospira noguchii TaxID=28182 RepID=UPI001F06356B|nr:hypothetical protein [Leptospira noguchii]